MNIVLTEEQKAFIDAPLLTNQSLISCPGSGKSISILCKIEHMFKNKQVKKKGETLIISFSRQQCDDLKEKVKKFNIQSIGQAQIMTIHSLCGKIYNSLTNRICTLTSKNTIVASVLHLLNGQVIKQDLNQQQNLKILKYVFVDEAQDVSEIQYKVIHKLCQTMEIPFVMIGDVNQNIYQFQGSSNQYLLNHASQTNTFNLTINQRSTKQIVQFVKEFQVYKQPMISNEEKHIYQTVQNSQTVNTDQMQIDTSYTHQQQQNPIPNIFQGSIEQVMQNIVQRIQTLGVPLEQIAIIGTLKKSQMFKNHQRNIGLSTICNMLDQNQIPYQQRYSLSNHNDDQCTTESKLGHINVLTIHNSKGLEFEAVFVIDFVFCAMNKKPTHQEHIQNQFLWFVGLTRAKRHLNIYLLQKQKIVPQVSYIDQSLFSSNFNLKANQTFTTNKVQNKQNNQLSQILNDKTIISPDKVLQIYQKLQINIKETQLTDPICIDSDIHQLFENFYKVFVRFVYFTSLNQYPSNSQSINQHDLFCDQLMQQVNSLVVINENFIDIFKEINDKYLLNYNGISDNVINQIMSDQELKCISYEHFGNFIEFLKQIQQQQQYKTLKEQYKQKCTMIYVNTNIEINVPFAQYIIENLRQSSQIEEQIKYLFQIVVYLFQIEYQANYLTSIDFSIQIKQIVENADKIKQFVKSFVFDTENDSSMFNFDFIQKSSYFNMYTKADIISNQTLIHMVYGKELQDHQIIYSVLQEVLNYDKSRNLRNVVIFNIKTGILHQISFDTQLVQNQLFGFLMFFAQLSMQQIQDRLFIYDLETTGLDLVNSQIIQIHMIDYYLKETVYSSYFNFTIPQIITQLTGITQQDVIGGQTDYIQLKVALQTIQTHCNNPRFLAHNGNQFDHQIMKNKQLIDQWNCRFMDSRQIFTYVLKQKGTISQSLSNIHQQICGHIPQGIHNAIVDVQMMVNILNVLNINKDIILHM